MIAIAPAAGWYAVFSKASREVRIPVAFFEVWVSTIADGTSIISRRTVAFDPRTKDLIDVLAVPQFIRLEYEPAPNRQRDRTVNIEKLRSFMSNFGVRDPQKELDAEIATAVKRELGKQRAAELIESLEDKDAL